MSRPIARWVIAAAVTAATFAITTWLCGAFVLPAVNVTDPAVRWGIAGGLGVALAALAALWGASYAEDAHRSEPEAPPSGAPPAAPAAPASEAPAPVAGSQSETTNEVSGGTFLGPLFQGRDFGDTAEKPQPGGSTHNTIRDGHFHGLVVQGRDFDGIDPDGAAQKAEPASSVDDQAGQE